MIAYTKSYSKRFLLILCNCFSPEPIRRSVDILAQTQLKGETTAIIIHVENQAYHQNDFNERMFIYFSRSHEKYRYRILPIAVFSHGEKKQEADRFEITFPFKDILNFQFYKLELHHIHWRDYIRHNNPVAAALLSQMGYSQAERVQVKKEFLRMLVRLEIDPARMQLIIGFFEQYLKKAKWKLPAKCYPKTGG